MGTFVCTPMEVIGVSGNTRVVERVKMDILFTVMCRNSYGPLPVGCVFSYRHYSDKYKVCRNVSVKSILLCNGCV